MSQQLTQLQDYMKAEKIDVVYLDNPTSVAYFTGFESNPHERIVAYVVTQKADFLFVPTLEKSEAINRSTIAAVYSYNDEENPWEIIGREISNLSPEIGKVGIDEMSLTVQRFDLLSQAILNRQADSELSVEFSDISEVIDQMRVIKTSDEINKMIEAGRLADQALQIGIDMLEEGITEQEVVATIDMEMKKLGVSEMSFTTLVLFGDHAASPHGKPGDRQLKANEFVLFDLGVIYEGYASDVTRTVAFGEVDERAKEIYNIVLKAQQTAQAAVKPGMRAGDLDQIARQVIEEAGYGEYFNHRLGHGIGKTAHEFPSVTGSNDLLFEVGMCFSIEPGIYIEGDIGVRVEDCVYVTETGCASFTHMDKNLITIELAD